MEPLRTEPDPIAILARTAANLKATHEALSGLEAVMYGTATSPHSPKPTANADDDGTATTQADNTGEQFRERPNDDANASPTENNALSQQQQPQQHVAQSQTSSSQPQPHQWSLPAEALSDLSSHVTSLIQVVQESHAIITELEIATASSNRCLRDQFKRQAAKHEKELAAAQQATELARQQHAETLRLNAALNSQVETVQAECQALQHQLALATAAQAAVVQPPSLPTQQFQPGTNVGGNIGRGTQSHPPNFHGNGSNTHHQSRPSDPFNGSHAVYDTDMPQPEVLLASPAPYNQPSHAPCLTTQQALCAPPCDPVTRGTPWLGHLARTVWALACDSEPLNLLVEGHQHRKDSIAVFAEDVVLSAEKRLAQLDGAAPTAGCGGGGGRSTATPSEPIVIDFDVLEGALGILGNVASEERPREKLSELAGSGLAVTLLRLVDSLGCVLTGSIAYNQILVAPANVSKFDSAGATTVGGGSVGLIEGSVGGGSAGGNGDAQMATASGQQPSSETTLLRCANAMWLALTALNNMIPLVPFCEAALGDGQWSTRVLSAVLLLNRHVVDEFVSQVELIERVRTQAASLMFGLVSYNGFQLLASQAAMDFFTGLCTDVNEVVRANASELAAKARERFDHRVHQSRV